jgi:hypothetical protein
MAGERKRFISRREFIEIVGAGITSIVGINCSYHALNEINRINSETQKVEDEQGATPPEQEALRVTQQIRNDSEEYTLKYRSPDEIRQASETETQQTKDDKGVNDRLSEKAGNILRSHVKFAAGAVAAGYGGGDAVRGLINIFSRSRRW